MYAAQKRESYLYVGMDLHKKTHTAVLVNCSNLLHFKSLDITIKTDFWMVNISVCSIQFKQLNNKCMRHSDHNRNAAVFARNTFQQM